MANIRKHANASQVDVRFWQEPKIWHVSIEDDGSGFDPMTSSSGGVAVISSCRSCVSVQRLSAGALSRMPGDPPVQ